MKVFLSWSGLRGKHVAESLRNWLPLVIQAVKPWMSQEDISSGTRWFQEVGAELEASTVGIICVTPENQHSPWLLFETGALSKTIAQTFVCPYLYDLGADQLSGPLAQFQSATADENGTKRIVKSLNHALDTIGLRQSELDQIFKVWWPQLEENLAACPTYEGKPVDKRPHEEIIREILENTREQLRREEVRLKRSESFRDQSQKIIDNMEKMAEMVQNIRQFAPDLDGSINKLGMDKNIDKILELQPELLKEILERARHNQNITEESRKEIISGQASLKNHSPKHDADDA